MLLKWPVRLDWGGRSIDDGDRWFVKCIAQNASAAPRVPVHCEEVSLQRWFEAAGDERWIEEMVQAVGESPPSEPTAATIDREFEFYDFFSFLKCNEF